MIATSGTAWLCWVVSIIDTSLCITVWVLDDATLVLWIRSRLTGMVWDDIQGNQCMLSVTSIKDARAWISLPVSCSRSVSFDTTLSDEGYVLLHDGAASLSARCWQQEELVNLMCYIGILSSYLPSQISHAIILDDRVGALHVDCLLGN
jgi:hypothetical protein